MPWRVTTGQGCPPSKPWAVVNEQTGRVVGCHATRGDAMAQLAALNANVPDARSQT